MNILVPVDKVGEIPVLNKVSPCEYYCGYIPKDWLEKYNMTLSKDESYQRIQVSINKREMLHANVKSIDELKTMISEARNCQSKIFLTLNAFYYPGNTYQYLESYIREIVEAGIHGFIVTDIGMIKFLKDNFPQADIVLSCCTQVANSLAVKLFRDLGVKRITFPRHITVDEMIEITNACPDLEYECFVLDARCIYDDGNCKILHSAGHFCYDQWDYDYYISEGDKKDITYEEMQNLFTNELSFKKWTKTFLTRSHRINGWMSMSCAACSIPALLKHSHVSTLKIVGRGSNLSEKIVMVKFVKKIINMAMDDNLSGIRAYAENVFKMSELCDNRVRCLTPSLKCKGNI